MTRVRWLAALLAGALATTPVVAADISTHVLDLARGVGGRDVPVVLARRGDDGRWVDVAKGRTDVNGRIKSFGEQPFAPGVYQLRFDMSGYPAADANAFFPEIVVVFRVSDPAGHYHVPVVYSPFGYSTYRGN